MGSCPGGISTGVLAGPVRAYAFDDLGELIELGHDARMMPPAYVKPYIRRQKNDAADAAAICEAVTRPLDAICRRALA